MTPIGRIMLNLIEDLATAASAVIAVPAAVVADVITIGGALADQDKPFTAQALIALSEDIEKVMGAGPATHDSPYERK